MLSTARIPLTCLPSHTLACSEKAREPNSGDSSAQVLCARVCASVYMFGCARVWVCKVCVCVCVCACACVRACVRVEDFVGSHLSG